MRMPSVESGEAKSLVRPFITEFRMASEKVYNFQPNTDILCYFYGWHVFKY